MKQTTKGTRTHEHLTAEEKREIIRLSKRVPRIPQIEIAKKFGCLPETVRELRKKAGVKLFREVTPELENQIVEVLRTGKGLHPTAKQFGVSTLKVKAIMVKRGIYHKIGDPGLGLKKHAEILKEVLKQKDFAVDIAEKVGVSSPTVLVTAHAIYGDGYFSHRDPLTSAENSDSNIENKFKTFAANIVRKISSLEGAMEGFEKRLETIYVNLIETHLATWYDSAVPADREKFVLGLVEICMPKSLRGKGPSTMDEWDIERVSTERYIRQALETVCGKESAWTN